MTNAETMALRRDLGEMRRSVRTLMMKYGDVPAVKRLFSDLDRLEIDIDDFAHARLVPVERAAAATSEKIAVPDTPYDSQWLGADDEGVGGYHGDRS